MTDTPVTLRPVLAADLALLERAAQAPDTEGLANWFGFRHAGAVGRRFEADGFLSDHDGLLMVLAAGAAAGHVSWRAVAHGPPATSRCWAIGIALWPEWRGRGLGAESQRLLVEYLFATTPVMRVEAETLADNLAEERALAKAGFWREGVLEAAQFHNGSWRDLVLYSRVRGREHGELAGRAAS